MPAKSPFQGVQQGDVAFVEFEGVAYRCYVWMLATEYTVGESEYVHGARIEAAIYVEQPHGGSVLLHRGTVRVPEAAHYVDCPRVVARGNHFHLHWIEFDPTEVAGDPVRPAGRRLHLSTFDLESSPYEWAHQGSIATSWMHLYDIHSPAADADYLLVHASGQTQLGLYRFGGVSWVDATWVSPIAGLSIEDNVLSVVATRRVSAVMFQAGGQLHALSIDWDTGALIAGPNSIAPALGDISAVAGTGIGSDQPEMFVVAEFVDTLPASSLDVPSTFSLFLDATDCSSSGMRTTRNVSLQSRPWRYTSPSRLDTDTPMFFAVLGYQDARPGSEWLQSSHYVVRYEGPASPHYGRPIPVGSLTASLAQAAPHGGAPRPAFGAGTQSLIGHPHQRKNHLPSATPAPHHGPLTKSYTTFLGHWTRIDTAEGPVTTVAGAGLRAVRFHHDDPWAFPYDASDPDLPEAPYASVAVGQLESVATPSGLFLSGGTPQTYDGRRFVEAGFPWAPEITRLAEDGSAGGADAGTYTYVAVFEWRDDRGHTHRSRPSTPRTITTSDGRAVNLEVRCCSLSMKDNEALVAESNPIKIDVYRTERDGTTFYPLFRGNQGFAYDLTSIPINDPSAVVVEVQDGKTDSQLRAALPLPFSFTSGVWSPIPPETPPAFSATAYWQNRVWGVSAEDSAEIWYSQEIRPEFAGEKYTIPEFSPDLTFRADGIGDIVGLAVLDSSLLLFSRDSIYSMYGTPADATGAGASLQLQQLQRHFGCVEPRSIAQAHDGVYFQSRRGMYRISGQNGLEYIGADVEDLMREAGNVRAVTVHEDSHQVRVLCGGAPYDAPQVLVYDWLMRMWAVWPLPAAGGGALGGIGIGGGDDPNAGRSSPVDAVAWRGTVGEHTHVVAQTSGILVQKPTTSPTRFADEGVGDNLVAIPVDVRTGWVHLAGLAGFQRVRRIGIHLEKPAPSGYTVEIEYDLDGSMTDGSQLQTEVVPYPAPAYFEFRTAIQKSNSLRIRLVEGVGTPIGEQLTTPTIALHAITLDVARKKGFNRVSPTAQRT